MKSKVSLTRIVFLSFLLCIAAAYAQPANVLVGDVTFTRPEKWGWEEPPKTSVALSRFTIPGPGGVTSKADVRFYIVKRDLAAERLSLLRDFPNASDTDVHEEEVKVGKQKIIYLRVTGTYKYKDNKPRPDQLWLGAVIPFGKDYIHARLQGPRRETEDYVATFKKMVEGAVREREVN